MHKTNTSLYLNRPLKTLNDRFNLPTSAPRFPFLLILHLRHRQTDVYFILLIGSTSIRLIKPCQKYFANSLGSWATYLHPRLRLMLSRPRCIWSIRLVRCAPRRIVLIGVEENTIFRGLLYGILATWSAQHILPTLDTFRILGWP